jgi:hypothetical protein
MASPVTVDRRLGDGVEDGGRGGATIFFVLVGLFGDWYLSGTVDAFFDELGTPSLRSFLCSFFLDEDLFLGAVLSSAFLGTFFFVESDIMMIYQVPTENKATSRSIRLSGSGQ